MNIVAKRTLTIILFLVVIFCISAYPVFYSLVQIWVNDTSFYHGFLVLPLFFVGCYFKKEIFDIYPIRFEPLTIPVLAIASSLMVISFITGINIIAHFLFVLCVMLLVVAGLGRHIVFNHFGLVAFLLFAVPFGTEFIIPLQNFTADVSVALMRLSGVDVTYKGIHIITSNARFYVAEACAGLRFLISNIFICYIFAYLSFKTKKSWIIFGIISALIPIIGNCLRVYGIMMIGHFTNGEYAVGVDHIVYGWGFFSVLAFINLMIGDWVARKEPFIETQTAPLLPFGVYDATRDIFFPYKHLYEKRICVSLVIILLIPFTLNNYFNDLFEKQKFNFNVQMNLLDIVPFKNQIISDKQAQLVTDFKNTDLQKAYTINDTTRLQIGYYHYQNANKDATSSQNIIHNEEDRLLLNQKTITHKGQPFNLILTGHLEGQKYLTLMTYFYSENGKIKYTNSKLDMQYYTLRNLLYYGKNTGGIILIDSAIMPNKTEVQTLNEMLDIVL